MRCCTAGGQGGQRNTRPGFCGCVGVEETCGGRVGTHTLRLCCAQPGLYCLCNTSLVQLATDRYITLAIAKKGPQEHWPRLLKAAGKPAPNIKVGG